MKLTSQDYRQAALMASIVAVVPLIFFPNSLGLGVKLSAFQFFIIELVYYWSAFAIIFRGSPFSEVFKSGTICFFSRLTVGVVFAFLAWFTHDVGIKSAFAAGLYQYMPAMVLQVISFPFILAPILKLLLNVNLKKASKPQFVLQSIDQEEESKSKPQSKPEDLTGRKIIGLKAEVADKPFTGFDDALKYVGELAAVRFAVLIDHQGLPISFYGENKSIRDLWSAIGIYLIDKIKEPLRRAGNYEIEGFELTLDLYRIHIIRIENVFLLAAADKNSGETEKVRIIQAAEMIKKVYKDKYSNKPESTIREESYVPSFS